MSPTVLTSTNFPSLSFARPDKTAELYKRAEQISQISCHIERDWFNLSQKKQQELTAFAYLVTQRPVTLADRISALWFGIQFVFSTQDKQEAFAVYALELRSIALQILSLVEKANPQYDVDIRVALETMIAEQKQTPEVVKDTRGWFKEVSDRALQ